MDKLIQRRAAAYMLGVSRQTLQSWIKKGILKSKEIGGTTFISEAAIRELADDLRDIISAREEIDRERQELERMRSEEEKLLKDIRSELRILPYCGEAIVRKEFYTSIIDMIGDEPDIADREKAILRGLMDGKDLTDIADRLGLTRERVRQLAVKAIRKSSHLINLRDIEKENKDMKQKLREADTILEHMHQRIEELESSLSIRKGTATKEELQQILATEISETDLSTRAKHSLMRKGVYSVADLVSRERLEIAHSRNIGPKTIKELDEFIESKGLHYSFDLSSRWLS